MPALTEHAAHQSTEQHGGQRGDAGQGADVAPFAARGRDAEAAQVGTDGVGVGLTGDDGAHGGDEHNGEEEHGQAIEQAGATGHPPGDVAAEEVGEQQDDGSGDGAAGSQPGPVVAAEVVAEPDGGGGRANQRGQDGESAVGHQCAGEHADERQLANTGLACQRGPVT
jgi:hypothetical protein